VHHTLSVRNVSSRHSPGFSKDYCQVIDCHVPRPHRTSDDIPRQRARGHRDRWRGALIFVTHIFRSVQGQSSLAFGSGQGIFLDRAGCCQISLTSLPLFLYYVYSFRLTKEKHSLWVTFGICRFNLLPSCSQWITNQTLVQDILDILSGAICPSTHD